MDHIKTNHRGYRPEVRSVSFMAELCKMVLGCQNDLREMLKGTTRDQFIDKATSIIAMWEWVKQFRMSSPAAGKAVSLTGVQR